MRNLTQEELYWKKVNKRMVFDDDLRETAACLDDAEHATFLRILDEQFDKHAYTRRIIPKSPVVGRHLTTCVGLNPLPGGKGCIGTTVCTCLNCLIRR